MLLFKMFPFSFWSSNLASSEPTSLQRSPHSAVDLFWGKFKIRCPSNGARPAIQDALSDRHQVFIRHLEFQDGLLR